MPYKGEEKEELGLMVCAAAIDLFSHLAGNESQHHSSHSFWAEDIPGGLHLNPHYLRPNYNTNTKALWPSCNSVVYNFGMQNFGSITIRYK